MNIAISYRERTEHRYYLSNPRESIMTTVLSCQRREILPFPTPVSFTQTHNEKSKQFSSGSFLICARHVGSPTVCQFAKRSTVSTLIRCHTFIRSKPRSVWNIECRRQISLDGSAKLHVYSLKLVFIIYYPSSSHLHQDTRW